MKLRGARVALDATRAEPIDLAIEKERIRFDRGGGPEIDLSGCLILPGLINAHDHLEFNVFPRLGRGPYANAAEWAADIYRPEEPPIRDLLRIPKSVRLFWGALKNLVSGVTTVSHHNPYEASVFDAEFPVRVVQKFAWAHSLDFSPNVDSRFREAPRSWPFIIHAGEGTDAKSREEIGLLDRLGVLTRRSVLVHAVAADAAAMSLIRRRGASLVWCPSSNFFLFGRTIDSDLLRSDVPVALGTDSGLTGAGDMLDELRIARKASGLDAHRLYRMVTSDAARVLRLRNGQGFIRHGGVADLVVVRDRGQTPCGAVLDLKPEMVMVGGRIRLLSTAFAERTGMPDSRKWARIEIEKRAAWLDIAAMPAVEGNLEIAGKRVRV